MSLSKREKVQMLADHGATEGERAAAREALKRMQPSPQSQRDIRNSYGPYPQDSPGVHVRTTTSGLGEVNISILFQQVFRNTHTRPSNTTSGG